MASAEFDSHEGDTQRCETCFTGQNTWEWNTHFESWAWSTCDSCGARALNGAQLADIQTIHDGDGQVLIGACLGSRKTGTTVGFINRHRGVWLGIVPLHVIGQWVDAIHEWSPGTEVHVITTRNKTGLIDLKESGPDAVHLIGWELARRKDWRLFKNIDGAFLDEAHRMSGYDTMTAKAVFRLNSTWRIALSGTPAGNALHFLWNALHWIWWGNNDHKTAKRFLRYKVRMGTLENPGWLRRHFYLTEEAPDRRRPEFTKTVVGKEIRFHSVVDEIPLYIQHLEDETCCEFHPGGVNASLPPIEDPIVIYTDMTPAQTKAYKNAVSDSPVLWLDSTDSDPEKVPLWLGDNDLVARLRARQIALAVPTYDGKDKDGKDIITMLPDAASSKADAWIDLARDITDEPVMVYTHSVPFARLLVERTNKEFGEGFAVEWTGEVDPALREQYRKHLFGRPGGPTVMVATQASIGEGTDGLQEVCRREVWASWDDNMLNNTQTVGRLRRTGQRRRIQRWDIVTRGTIEEKQIKGLIARKKGLDLSLKATPVVREVQTVPKMIPIENWMD